MKASIDVRKLADAVFEKATRFCLENRVLLRARFLLDASGELTAIPLHGSKNVGKNRELEDAQESGRATEPVAIFTLRDSLYRCYAAEESLQTGEESGVPDGWIADGQLHNCLNMRVEVPGEKAICIAVPFLRDDSGALEFGEPSEGEEAFVRSAPAGRLSAEDLEN